MLKPVGGWSSLLANTFLLFVFTTTSAAQDFSSAANQFATKISAHVASSAASLIVKNRSSLNDSTVSLVRSELQQDLQARGWKLKKAEETGASIAIVLSENLSSYVWSAEIDPGQGGPKEVVLFELARPTENPESTGDSISLSRTLLVSSDTAILDVTLLEGKLTEGAHLLALGSNSVQLYRLQSSQWHLDQTQPLNAGPLPGRDMRGRIVPGQGSSFDAFLPGLHCTGVVTASLTLSCRQSDDPWPLSDDARVLAFYAPHRNYFNGVVMGSSGTTETSAPFYSVAIFGDQLVYATLDGRNRSSRGMPQPAGAAPKWGSNVAAIQSSCSSSLLLGTSSSDFDSEDSVTAFRASGPDFLGASEPLSFSGPVTGLKTSTDHQQAIAVVASLFGRYEAYLLTARCGS